mmetsp:Transcript_27730/g.66807  ORF Transcript_27730/g.66807 Transcript_27730/m.66807 type:complete len:578 (-) Transcript_27730:495-2228(-)
MHSVHHVVVKRAVLFVAAHHHIPHHRSATATVCLLVKLVKWLLLIIPLYHAQHWSSSFSAIAHHQSSIHHHRWRRRRDATKSSSIGRVRNPPRQLIPRAHLVPPRIPERLEFPPSFVIRLAECRHERSVRLIVVMRIRPCVDALGGRCLLLSVLVGEEFVRSRYVEIDVVSFLVVGTSVVHVVSGVRRRRSRVVVVAIHCLWTTFPRRRHSLLLLEMRHWRRRRRRHPRHALLLPPMIKRKLRRRRHMHHRTPLLEFHPIKIEGGLVILERRRRRMRSERRFALLVLDTTVQSSINEQHIHVFHLGMKLVFRILQSLVDTIDPRFETCDLIVVSLLSSYHVVAAHCCSHAVGGRCSSSIAHYLLLSQLPTATPPCVELVDDVLDLTLKLSVERCAEVPILPLIGRSTTATTTTCIAVAVLGTASDALASIAIIATTPWCVNIIANHTLLAAINPLGNVFHPRIQLPDIACLSVLGYLYLPQQIRHGFEIYGHVVLERLEAAIVPSFIVADGRVVVIVARHAPPVTSSCGILYEVTIIVADVIPPTVRSDPPTIPHLLPPQRTFHLTTLPKVAFRYLG